MKRIAVDIETLATTPTAAITAIGIVIQKDLDPNSRIGEIWLIDPQLAIGDRDSATIKWWSEQSELARKIAFGGKDHPQDVCNSINFWLQTHLDSGVPEERCYYANPARFDFAILHNLFIRCGVEPYIHWREERCQRTLDKELGDLGVSIPEFPNFCPHDPVSDCIHQLDELNWILSYLEGAVKYHQQGIKMYSERPGL